VRKSPSASYTHYVVNPLCCEEFGKKGGQVRDHLRGPIKSIIVNFHLIKQSVPNEIFKHMDKGCGKNFDLKLQMQENQFYL
jgi:hypothetical protein